MVGSCGEATTPSTLRATLTIVPYLSSPERALKRAEILPACNANEKQIAARSPVKAIVARATDNELIQSMIGPNCVAKSAVIARYTNSNEFESLPALHIVHKLTGKRTPTAANAHFSMSMCV